MGWGGRRANSGPKRRRERKEPVERPALRAEPKLPGKPVPTSVDAQTNLPAAISPQTWVEMLPAIKEISERYARNKAREPSMNPFRLPDFPKDVLPPKDIGGTMAMDDALSAANSFASEAWLAGAGIGNLPAEGMLFMGYPFLAELAQRPEYRVMSETIADDATRKWIDFDVVGDEKKQKEDRAKDPEGYDERMADPDEKKKRVEQAGKTDKVKALKDDQLRLAVKDHFYEQARNDGFFGRNHLYLDIWPDGVEPSPQEKTTPIGDSRDAASKTKVTKGSFRRLRSIEPVWCYPLMYNAVNPIDESFYNPQTWYVQGQQIHGSRLQTFIGHPVPDLLKPAYAFGGLSLSQMAKPYVDIWLTTRQSIADLIHSFSVMVLMTDLSTLMQPGNVNALLARVAMFNMFRDNQGAFVVNKNTEDFKNVSASLAGLHELQSQAQEHMASVHRIPLVKFTGIQPAGLNASSEGEIEVYDDTISAYQSRFFSPNLTRVVNFEQLSLFGEIDPEITWHFKPLRELTEAEKGDKLKKDGETRQLYVDMGAFSPGEIRKIAIEDPELPFTDLDPEDVPDLAEEEEEGLEPHGGKPDPKAEGEPDNDNDEGGGANDAADPFGERDDELILDAALLAADEFRESDHPRAPDGKFGSGGGSSSPGKTGEMPDIPDFLKKNKGGEEKQKLKMPQFGLTPMPWESHQGGSLFWKPRERAPMPKSEGEPGAKSSVVAFEPGADHGVKELNGVALTPYSPPDDWADVEGQAEIDEPPLPDLPKGMTMSTGVVIREKDGRVWLMRPAKGFGGYDQTFPKGGLEEGLPPQANAIKEAYEETGLKVKITGFAGDHEGDTTVSRFYFAEREGGDPADAGWEAEGVVLVPPEKLDGMLNRKRDKAIAAALSPAAQKPLDPKTLKKIGGKLGSNEGGQFEDADGNKFYVKRPETKAHVENELAAARLYQLAGVQTLDYRPVEGGNHVATAWEKLDKNNVSKMSAAERKEATSDFAVHSWLSNWDAAGTGGDNQGVRNGRPVTLDVGGSLRYRAQGSPKGKAFGPQVTEVDTMRDPAKSHDAAKLFGKMSDADLKASVERVTSIPDAAIRQAVGDDKDLADTLIARKGYLAARFKTQAADEAAAKRTLYVNRPLRNAEALRAWAEGQGFRSTLPADDMHVTIAFSKEPMEWPRARGGTVRQVAGERSIEALGEGAVVLRFESPELRARWQELRDAGASWDHDGYKPHVTITYDGAGVDLDEVEPYTGPLEFGPEKLAEVKASWAADEAQFSESDHPRDADGKFASSGSGGSSGTFKSKKEHASHLLQKGTTTKEILAALGWPSISMPQMAKTLGLKLEKTTEGGVTKYKGTPMTDAEKKAATEEAKGKKTDAQAQQILKNVGLGGMAGQKAPSLVKTISITAKHGPATAEELAKAKKSVALQIQYVPGAPQTPEAQALVDKFNKEWSGKEGLIPAQLQQKVDAFKDLKASMIPLMTDIQKKQHAASEAQKVAAQNAAKAAAAKIAAEMNDPAVKEHYEVLKGIGAGAKELWSSAEKTIKKHNLKITSQQGAYIRAYVGSHYGPVNRQLRSDKGVTVEQWKYAAALDDALDKMPTYSGDIFRGANLEPEQFARYKNAVGKVLQEPGFQSYGVKGKLWGSYNFYTKSKSARDIRSFNAGEGGGEVVFKNNTAFKVTKVEGKDIYMEEV